MMDEKNLVGGNVAGEGTRAVEQRTKCAEMRTKSTEGRTKLLFQKVSRWFKDMTGRFCHPQTEVGELRRNGALLSIISILAFMCYMHDARINLPTLLDLFIGMLILAVASFGLGLVLARPNEKAGETISRSSRRTVRTIRALLLLCIVWSIIALFVSQEPHVQAWANRIPSMKALAEIQLDLVEELLEWVLRLVQSI